MLTILWTCIKRYSKAIAIVLAFLAGVSVTHLYESKKFSEYKNAELQAVINSYEEQLKNVETARLRLDNDLLRYRNLASERLRDLEQYKQRHPESEGGECRRILDLAVRGEGLLQRADAMLGALMK